MFEEQKVSSGGHLILQDVSQLKKQARTRIYNLDKCLTTDCSMVRLLGPTQQSAYEEERGSNSQTSAQQFLRIDSTGVSKAKVSERAAFKHCRRASPVSLPKSLLQVLIFSTKAGIS